MEAGGAQSEVGSSLGLESMMSLIGFGICAEAAAWRGPREPKGLCLGVDGVSPTPSRFSNLGTLYLGT